MTLPAKLTLVVLFCMGAAVLVLLGQMLGRRPATWLRDLLSAVVVVGLAACLLAVMTFVLGAK